jgi:hypothetical protein
MYLSRKRENGFGFEPFGHGASDELIALAEPAARTSARSGGPNVRRKNDVTGSSTSATSR